MLVEIRLNQPQNNVLPYINQNVDQRIAWHIKKIMEAKSKIEYHEEKLLSLQHANGGM